MLVDGATISDGGDNPAPFLRRQRRQQHSTADMPSKVIEMTGLWPSWWLKG